MMRETQPTTILTKSASQLRQELSPGRLLHTRRIAVTPRLNLYLAVPLLFCSGILSACASKGTLVPMQEFENVFFSIEYPRDWHVSRLEAFGTIKVVFSSQELSAEEENLLAEPGFAVEIPEFPFVVLMFDSRNLADKTGLDNTVQYFVESVSQADGAPKIIKQEDIAISGEEGRLLVVEGYQSAIGKIGVRAAFAMKENGSSIVFIGVTSEKNLNSSFKVFEQMQRSLKFAE